MMGITFNGVHSNTIKGLKYITSKRPIMPELKDEYIDIPMKSGSILIPDTTAKDIMIEVNFAIEADNVQELYNTARQIGTWLTTTNREPLIFDDDPNCAYTAKASTNISLEQLTDFENVAEFTVFFRCLPNPTVKEDVDPTSIWLSELRFDTVDCLSIPNALLLPGIYEKDDITAELFYTTAKEYRWLYFTLKQEYSDYHVYYHEFYSDGDDYISYANEVTWPFPGAGDGWVLTHSMIKIFPVPKEEFDPMIHIGQAIGFKWVKQ